MVDIADLIKRLEKYSVPELCDGTDERIYMDYTLKEMVTDYKVVGPAKTVTVPIGDSGVVSEAIRTVKEGEIIVVAGQGGMNIAYWGDHKSYCAKFQRARGVVIDGAFRDIDACEEIDFPVFAKGLTAVKSGKSGNGAIDVQISCGGVVVNPGDIIVGDRNGVCVIRPELAEEIMKNTQKKIHNQRRTMEEMERTGIVMPDILK